ncbi:hypothetical protein CHUAL_003955 [Chamberlinius hualienensis]
MVNCDNRQDSQKQLFCGLVYDPLWILFYMIGIDQKSFTSESKRSTLRRVVFATIAFFYLSVSVIYTAIVVIKFFLINHDLTVAHLSFIVNTIINVTQLLISYGMFTLNQKKMSTFLLKLNDVCHIIIGTDMKNYKILKQFVRKCLVFTLFITIAFYLTAATDDENGSNHKGQIDVGDIVMSDHARFFVDSSYAEVETALTVSMLAIGGSVNHFFRYFFVIYYLVTAQIILFIFKNLSNLLDKNCTSVADVKRLIKHHQQLCEIVQLFDLNFQKILAIWNFTETFGIILILRAMDLEFINSDWCFDREAGFFVIFTIFLFVVKAGVAAEINEKVKTSLDLVYNNWSTNPAMEPTSTIYEMIEFYSCLIEIDPPTLTGWRLYIIDKNLVLNVEGFSAASMTAHNAEKTGVIVRRNSWLRVG